VYATDLASFNESTESIEQEPEQDSPNENDTSTAGDTQTETDDGAPEDDDSCVLPKPAIRLAFPNLFCHLLEQFSVCSLNVCCSGDAKVLPLIQLFDSFGCLILVT
jgi:hypothetical protein